MTARTSPAKTRRRSRSPTGLLAAAAALAAAGVMILAAGPTGPHRPATHSPAGPAAQPAAQPPPVQVRTSTPPRPSAPAEEPDSRHKPRFADTAVQKGLEAGAPPPDIPAAQEEALVALAGQIWRADLTGRGRDRWPGYFRGARPAAVYTRVRIQAGIARRDGADDIVNVVLIWAGRDPHGTYADQQRILIRLGWDGTSWQPQ